MSNIKIKENLQQQKTHPNISFIIPTNYSTFSYSTYNPLIFLLYYKQNLFSNFSIFYKHFLSRAFVVVVVVVAKDEIVIYL